STHILEEVDAVCTRAMIITAGRVVADATPAELGSRHPSGKLDDVFRQLTMTSTMRSSGSPPGSPLGPPPIEPTRDEGAA
ncbi:MAG TPA: hypothetical protein VIG49_15810, partial [Acetobacteraceae bacterium]